tara:strand:+ start:424 stop:693 length:270 start_codon:yes stop_codon:yes gene_type:complete
MAETRKIVGCYNVEGISTEGYVKEILDWFNSGYSITTQSISEADSKASYGVTRFPCFIMIKNGSVLAKKQGKYMRNDYQQWIKNYGWDS